MINIKIIQSLTGSEIIKSVSELFQELSDNFDIEFPDESKNYYEFFDMKTQKFKLHFDFDKKLDIKYYKNFDKERYMNDITDKLEKIFGISKNEWAISEDCRITKDTHKNKIYKVSYHFISINKYITQKHFPLLKKLNKYFAQSDIKFDTSIYRNGITRFRIIMCKKDNELNSVLKPVTFITDIKKHLIQITENCEELIIKEDIELILKNNISSKKNIENMIKGFNIIGTKLINGVKIHNVGRNCCFIEGEHKSNNGYLIEKKDSLIYKCFSPRCKNKIKVLFINKKDYSIFNINDFNVIKVKSGKQDNYLEKRDYFEKHYKLFRDNATLYRVDYYVNGLGIYQTKLIEVKEKGLDNLFYLQFDKKLNKLIDAPFYKRYRFDSTRKEYIKIEFEPTKNTERTYNLFTGWNYENVLDEDDEITKQDTKDLEFLLNHIKKNICDNKDEVYDYFISNWAILLQYPKFRTHIINVFYSSEEGTGKSSFIKFFAKVIGELYSFFGSVENIMEKHSNAGVGRFINVIEELKIGHNYMEELKNYSQRELGPYNEKNKTIVDIMYYVNYIICTNNSNCLKLKRKERRYAIYGFAKISNIDDINRLDKIYDNKKIIYLFGNYLMTYKLSKEKHNRKWWEDNKPNTKSYKLFMYNDTVGLLLKDIYSKSNFFDIDEKLEAYIIDDIITIPKSDLNNVYKLYCEDNGTKKKSRTNFYKSIKEEYKFIKIKSIERKEHYEIDLRLLYKELNFDGEYINRYLDEEEKEDEWIPKENKINYYGNIAYKYIDWNTSYSRLKKDGIIVSTTQYNTDSTYQGDKLWIIIKPKKIKRKLKIEDI